MLSDIISCVTLFFPLFHFIFVFFFFCINNSCYVYFLRCTFFFTFSMGFLACYRFCLDGNSNLRCLDSVGITFGAFAPAKIEVKCTMLKHETVSENG